MRRQHTEMAAQLEALAVAEAASSSRAERAAEQAQRQVEAAGAARGQRLQAQLESTLADERRYMCTYPPRPIAAPLRTSGTNLFIILEDAHHSR